MFVWETRWGGAFYISAVALKFESFLGRGFSPASLFELSHA